MRKVIFIIALGMGYLNLVYAQNQQENLPNDFDELLEEMQKAMKDMEGLFGNSNILIDTFMIKGIDPLNKSFDGFPQIHPDSLNLDSMIDILQQQMQQMDAQDWSQLEELMKNFMQQFPERTPTPSKKKKRKIITL